LRIVKNEIKVSSLTRQLTRYQRSSVKHGKIKEGTVTGKKEKADYVAILEHEGGKDPISKDNKFALFNKEGDVIKSGSTRSLGNAVKEACRAIMKDWGESASSKEASTAKTEKTGS
jgi:hypothetical protein